MAHMPPGRTKSKGDTEMVAKREFMRPSMCMQMRAQHDRNLRGKQSEWDTWPAEPVSPLGGGPVDDRRTKKQEGFQSIF